MGIEVDTTYKTTSMEGIASVSDIVVAGTFQSKESYVENGLIFTRGEIKVDQVLHGDCPDTITVSMGGGTIPYKDIDQIYTPEELEKYGLDPDNPDYTEYSTVFADMPVFKTGQRYLITLAVKDNGEYAIMPSVFSLCTLPETDEEPAGLRSAAEIEQATAEATGQDEGLDGTVFSIEEYRSYFN